MSINSSNLKELDGESDRLLASTARAKSHNDLEHRQISDPHPRTLRPEPSEVLTFLKKAVLVLLLIASYFTWQFIPAWNKVKDNQQQAVTDLLDFDNIIPNEKLQWHACFAYEPAFKCARLIMPMDYHRPLNESQAHPKVAVALILMPGKHDGHEKFSISPLIVNPGGPGGSGVDLVLSLHEFLSRTVPENQDIIGFDPRGVGATTPRTDCFSYPAEWPSAQADDVTTGGGEDYSKGHFNRMLWRTAGRGIGNVNSDSWETLEMLDARAKGLAKACKDKDTAIGENSIFKYVNTPNVVRDMRGIVDAWDEWMDSQNSCKIEISHDNREYHSLGQAGNSLSTRGKLVYWGFSYGTLIGATFASMFPDRVGRMILDGIVDADHYVAPVWTGSLRDTDTIFDSFPSACHEAKELCPLYRAGDKVSDLSDRFFQTLENLKTRPIFFTDPATKSPTVVTYSDIRLLFFSSLYFPMAGFYGMGQVIDLILRDELQQLAPFFSLSAPFDMYPKPGCERPLPAWKYPNEAQIAIMCSDKRYPLNDTIPSLKLRFEETFKVSTWADIWLTIMIGCESWGIEAIDPPMDWDDHPAHKQKPINTSFPILFLSNTYDPVTPLYAALQMAKKFVGAGLLEQKSMGHTSMAARSKCVSTKLRAYLTNGEVPPPPKEGGEGKELEDGEWDRCEADEWPFHPYAGEQAVSDAEATEGNGAIKAMKEMQRIFSELKPWGQAQALPYSVLNRKFT